MKNEYILLPAPRNINYSDGICNIDPAGAKPVVSIDPSHVPHEQGYKLTVSVEQIIIVAHDEAGAFYGAQTLKQICRQLTQGDPLRQLTIDDWPDFLNRGVMLDISRDKVPQMKTLYELIDLLAEWKINQFQLYTEHTFAYKNHRQVWADASPMTGEEIVKLDEYCRQRFVELVPNQNSFGHMAPWLRHERYKPLAETPDGFQSESGWHEAFSLSPAVPGSIELIAELYDELLPHFSSGQFNVGCDETFDLGYGRSAELCEKIGKGRVYLDFLLKIHELTRKHGKVMQLWGDIILKHPELIEELPDNIIVLEWGYEADHPFAEHCRKFAEAKVPFYVCPGTSTWSTIAGRTENAMQNLSSAAEHGLTFGAIGYLITNWGDHGHWQSLPVCSLGYAYGAALSWAGKANRQIDIVKALDVHAFKDEASVTGRVVYDLGNAYKVPGVTIFNRSVLFNLLIDPQRSLSEEPYNGLTIAGLERTLAYIDEVVEPLDKVRMKRPDAKQIVDELNCAAELLRHSCRLGIGRLRTEDAKISSIPEETRNELAGELEKIIKEYKRLWLLRNRTGGLADSVARLERILISYQTPKG